MISHRVPASRLLGVLIAAFFLVSSANAGAAPLLRRGDVRIAITSPGACDVTMALTVEGTAEVDHRIDAPPDASIELVEVRRASQVGDLRTIGRTKSLVVRPEGPAYEFRYRARQPDDRRDRCSLWLPLVPTDGQSDAIRIQIDLPPSSVPGGSFPAFSWQGTQGVATLGHLPAFVRLQFVAAGESIPWDVSRTMDAAALVAFAAASALWLRYRRR
jgi:hypothetical protein